jgi:hypothetical protein
VTSAQCVFGERSAAGVAEGVHLKTWRGGPDAGKPKAVADGEGVDRAFGLIPETPFHGGSSPKRA